MLLTACNPIGAKPGQIVTVRTESGPVLAAAAVLYLVPLALFFAGYLAFALSWKLGALGGALGFVLGVVISMIYDRKVVRRKQTVYTITGFGNAAQFPDKGDNDLD